MKSVFYKNKLAHYEIPPVLRNKCKCLIHDNKKCSENIDYTQVCLGIFKRKRQLVGKLKYYGLYDVVVSTVAEASVYALNGVKVNYRHRKNKLGVVESNLVYTFTGKPLNIKEAYNNCDRLLNYNARMNSIGRIKNDNNYYNLSHEYEYGIDTGTYKIIDSKRVDIYNTDIRRDCVKSQEYMQIYMSEKFK